MDIETMQAFRTARRNGRTGWTAPVAASPVRQALRATASVQALPTDSDWFWDENGMITF